MREKALCGISQDRLRTARHGFAWVLSFREEPVLNSMQ
jgi:hypothetical protein